MDAEDEGTYRGSSFFCYLGFNLLYVSVAILCVYIEPVSAGSGIPEVKCYLNGINVPRNRPSADLILQGLWGLV